VTKHNEERNVGLKVQHMCFSVVPLNSYKADA